MDFSKIVEQAENGEINPLDAFVELRSISKECAEAIEALQVLCHDEVAKYGKGPCIKNGYQFKVMNGRTTWDYKGVSIWENAKSRLDDIQKLAQQVATKGVEIIDKETGEIIEPATAKHGKSFIQITKV